MNKYLSHIKSIISHLKYNEKILSKEQSYALKYIDRKSSVNLDENKVKKFKDIVKHYYEDIKYTQEQRDEYMLTRFDHKNEHMSKPPIQYIKEG